MIKNKYVSPSAGSEGSLASGQRPHSFLWNCQAKFSVSRAIRRLSPPPRVSFFLFLILLPFPQSLPAETLDLQTPCRSVLVLAPFCFSFHSGYWQLLVWTGCKRQGHLEQWVNRPLGFIWESSVNWWEDLVGKTTIQNGISHFYAAACPSLVKLNFYLGASFPGIEEWETLSQIFFFQIINSHMLQKQSNKYSSSI